MNTQNSNLAFTSWQEILNWRIIILTGETQSLFYGLLLSDKIDVCWVNKDYFDFWKKKQQQQQM